MDIVTRGPLSAATLLWQRGSGWVLTVICKTTFDLVPGEAKLRADPLPPADRDVPWSAPYGASFRTVTDFVPVKQNIDVLLTGHAYAPWGKAARSIVARLVVGTLDKSIEVIADRHFDRAGNLVEGAPFTRMPLVYERAAGGMGTWNPAGISSGQKDAQGHIPLPNLMVPGTRIAAPDQLFIAPTGFGPIPADWPSRVEKLGRRSHRDVPTDWNGQSVPDDIARDYFNAALADQQISMLREEDTITLEQLHPSHPSFSCKLPALRPTMTCDVNGTAASIVPRIDTLHIDTDRATCTLIWRGHLPLRDPREAGKITVALDTPGPANRRPVLTGVEPSSAATTTIDAAFEGTLTFPPGLSAPALPFPTSPTRAAAAPTPLSQSSASWEAVRASSPPAQSPTSWESQTLLPPQAPRPSSQSSSSWRAVVPPTEAPPPADQSSPSRPAVAAPQNPSPLSQSGSSWGSSAAPPAQDRISAASADTRLPPPAMSPPPRPPIPAREVAPPAAVSAPALISPPALASVPESGSPWAAGSATAPKRETIGMQAISGSLALSDPKYEPLPAVSSANDGASVSLQLLWFDPESVARIRRVPRWKKHLDEFQREPLDRDLDDSGAREPWEIEDRREVFEVLAHGAQSDARGVEEALLQGRRADGKLVPPLVLVEGEVEVQLDELQALRATVTIASVFAAGDEPLKGAIAEAREFLQAPDLLSPPGVIDGLTTRILEAFRKVRRAVSPNYVEEQTERALLSGRHYQKREVLGGTFLRAFIWMPGDKDALLAYLPEDLAKKLPMYRRFKARVVADVHPQQDQYEVRALGLRVLAVGRAG